MFNANRLFATLFTTSLVSGTLGLLPSVAEATPWDSVNSNASLPTTPQRRRIGKTFQSGDYTSTQTRVSDLQSPTLQQVTSVSELRDVQPTEWAYEALKSLVERYGCLVGYPDRTYRGDRSLSRYEFAAGLNACLNVMERLVQENVAVLR